MDEVEFARLQAVEQAVIVLVTTPGRITKSEVRTALATPPPPLPPLPPALDDRFADDRFDTARFH